jgi:uncharacterized protein (TIGR03000 family)
MGRYLLAMVLGVTGMLMTPGESHAQRWRGAGSRLGGGYGGYGRGYYGGRGYDGWGGGGYGWGNYGYPSYYSGNMPSYYGQPSYSGNYISPNTSTSFYYSPADRAASAGMSEKAQVEVHLPADAKLWVDGQPTTETGETRKLETAPMAVGQQFTYQLRAQWMKDGKPVDETRSVNLFAGAKQVIDFSKQGGDSNKRPGDLDKKPGDLDKKPGDLDKKPGDLDKKPAVPDKN